MNIEALEIRSHVDGWKVTFFPALIEANDKLFLTDSGYEETYEDLVRVLKSKKVNISDISGILISHDDIDHIGALYKFKEQNPGLIIYSSEIEEPSLSGKIKSERLLQAESLYNSLPGNHKKWAKEFQESLENIKRVSIDKTLKDSELIEEKIQAINTPGHTKGHLSFYIPEEKTFITGDAFVFENNKFKIANPRHTLDFKEAVSSLIKIRKLDIKKVICYHGGVVTDNISLRLDQLINNYKQ